MKPQLISQKFGRLTVVEYISRPIGYKCVCDCGKETTARSYALKTGRHRSCGCLMREIQAKRLYKGGFIALDNEIFHNYRQAAARRKYEFSLTREKFVKLIHAPCHYCGLEPHMEWYGVKRKIIDTSSFRYSGVDRKNNNEGYTTTNCVPCCKICNNSKSILSEGEWFDWLKRVVKFNPERFND